MRLPQSGEEGKEGEGRGERGLNQTEGREERREAGTVRLEVESESGET